jgi:acyl dehydratase
MTSTRRSVTIPFSDVSVGDPLPDLRIEITATLIVSGAIASRDFEGVHLDRDWAQRQGSKDIFMNILASNGLVGRYVTDWAGPDSLLKSVDIRLGAPNYPGDTMVLAGRVIARQTTDSGGIVDVEVIGRNGLGDHVTAVVRVQLPEASR